MSNKGIIVIAIIALIVVVGVLGYTLMGNQEETKDEDESANPNQLVPAPGFEDVDEMIVEEGDVSEEERPLTELSAEHTVEITNNGFVPSTITISWGDKITWINKMTNGEKSWPASAVHPTHKAYPGSDIQKCFGAEKDTIFDACKGLSEGESWTFTFNEKGSWNYHDHSNTAFTGTIIVGD